MVLRVALRFVLLLASHPSAEHCISNALTLAIFRVVGILLDNFICSRGSQKPCVFSPAKKPLYFCLLAALWKGERTGQNCIFRQIYTVNFRKTETCLVDPVDLCLS